MEFISPVPSGYLFTANTLYVESKNMVQINVFTNQQYITVIENKLMVNKVIMVIQVYATTNSTEEA